MSGHTNRNRRNGGNPRSRHGSQRKREADGRISQPKNNAPPPADEKSAASERKPGRENLRPQQPSQPPQPGAGSGHEQPPAQQDARREAQSSNEPDAMPERSEYPEQPVQQESANPRGRPPFTSALRGGRAYIPASGGNPTNGMRPGLNGQNGQNGQSGQNGHRGPNGHHDASSANSSNGHHLGERPVWVRDDEDDEGEGGDIPRTWRIERLNGGTDTTPHDPVRPESRGEVGPLIDTLHDLFAQDRAMASRGDSARCGICYLHFPLTALDHRETEGFYVCEGCKRALGHQQVMMVRRQQAPGG